ncbi:MAG: ribosome biogenesis GTP-binding protein YihA/YsxC [Succiniclasticum sp.]|jgi:GTP-binding protein|nr:ribosome biogenesis GTP-binding protein YihA/YsxC [Succiniclasticum sp.]MCI6223314.1 ribosome biogenesis GTP-binding protein YihA/YsxC [Selenomonadales bacterium]MDY2869509.1 ribosome biogenesis GTP-binding protein YihA/YsxC [Succiniclasticum sp.]
MAKGQWDVVKADFVTSAVQADQYPKPSLPQVAFIGRSNVGKSSLINSVCRRNGLARVSATPGKTQTLNFYQLQAKRTLDDAVDRTQFYLVDLPGYGFARTNRHNKEIWSGFIRNYLTDAPDLVLVCQLIDIRHRLMDSDIEAYQWMVSCGLQVQLVLTKMDKLSKSAAMAQVAAVQREMSLTDAQVMAYSVLQPVMRFELINRILGTLLSSSEVVTEAPALR